VRHGIDSKARLNRGAARVGLVWIVLMAVITLVSIGFGYTAHDDRAKAQLAVTEAQTASATAEQRYLEASQANLELTRKLGFYDRTQAAAKSDPASAASALAGFREIFTDIPADATDFEKALPFAEAQYNASKQRIESLVGQVASLTSEVSEARSSRTRDLTAKDGEITGLRNELAAERQNASERETNLNARLADSEEAANALDRRVREIEAANEEALRGKNVEIADLQLRNKALASKLDLRLQRARVEEPDGSITSVSQTLPLAWIDRGTDDRLAPGMGFEVRASRLSGAVTKARAIVRRVERNRAEIEVLGLVDQFDPIVPGDHVFSPIYDPVGERTAVLAGRFSGNWDEQRLTIVLAEMGIRVQSTLTGTTDMLITGGEIFYDELGEPLEEPLDPSQLPVYAEAVNGNVTIVPLSTLRDYLPALP